MSRWKKEISEAPQSESSSRYYATAGKTENFFTRNVRLITFLITLGVLLVILGPIAVLEAKNYFVPDYDSRPQMTKADVIRISQMNYIPEKAIREFASVEDEHDYEVYYYIDIEPNYKLLAIADKKSGMLIYCQLSNLGTGESVNVLEEDVEKFFNSKK